ncbi:hypothetical protein RB595_010584 [Gaeumannomyces hyphopodioides]
MADTTAATSPPATMRGWQVNTPGPLAKNLRLNDAIPYPSQPLKQGQVLVRVAYASINPADYKLPELGLAARAVLKLPKTLAMDLSGRVMAAGPGSQLEPGARVVGRVDPLQSAGGLSEYVVLDRDGCAPVADSVPLDQAAGAGTAGLTALQSIVPNVAVVAVVGEGAQAPRVFLNGGTGGTGTFAIQIAKAAGCHVTVSCSTAKVELCKGLGADEVVDYKTTDVVKYLQDQGPVYDLAVDYVGTPSNLYKAADVYLKPAAKFVMVAGGPGLAGVVGTARNIVLPGFLGGGKRKFDVYMTKNRHDDLARLAKWMEEGKVKTVVHKVFPFDQTPQAFEELKKGVATGKIVIRVGEEA